MVALAVLQRCAMFQDAKLTSWCGAVGSSVAAIVTGAETARALNAGRAGGAVAACKRCHTMQAMQLHVKILQGWGVSTGLPFKQQMRTAAVQTPALKIAAAATAMWQLMPNMLSNTAAWCWLWDTELVLLQVSTST